MIPVDMATLPLLGGHHRPMAGAQTTVFTARRVITMDSNLPEATAVAVSAGRITAVGALNDLREATTLVDDTFAGAVICPGLIDQHLHPLLGATTLVTEVIATEDWVLPGKTYLAARSAADYQERITAAERALTDPGEWLFSWGYHKLWHGPLDRSALDGVSATRPIAVWQRSCHEWYLNTAAIDALGFTAADMAGHSPASEMVDFDAGHWWETGMNLLLPKLSPVFLSPERVTAGLKQLVAYLHRNGVTAINEPGIMWDLEPWGLYQHILGATETPFVSTFLVDARGQADSGMDPAAAIADAEEQVARASSGKVRLLPKQVKLFADGAIISQWVDEDRDLGGVHVGEVGSERLGHLDPAAVVLFDRCGRASGDPRRVLRHHRLVVGEAAHGQHHALARADGQVAAVAAGADTDHPAVGLDDQAADPHVVERPHAGRRRRLDERLHQHVAGAGFALLLVGHLRDVPARSRGGDRIERVRIFSSAVHQALVAHRFPAGLGEELRFERNPAVDEPVEMSDAACAVIGDPLLVGARPHRDVEEGRHVVHGIAETAGLLERGAATEIDEPAGHRSCPTPGPGAFDDQDVGAGVGRFDRCGGTRDSVPGDDDVGLVVPRAHRGGRDRCDVKVGAHGCIAAGISPTH